MEVLDGDASFKEDLYPMFTTGFLEALTQPFVVRNHHVRVLDVVVSRIVGASSAVFLSWGIGLDLHPVESPYLHFVSTSDRCFSSCCNT